VAVYGPQGWWDAYSLFAANLVVLTGAVATGWLLGLLLPALSSHRLSVARVARQTVLLTCGVYLISPLLQVCLMRWVCLSVLLSTCQCRHCWALLTGTAERRAAHAVSHVQSEAV
jgi:hypothetical protein